jgi:outer membrane protein OmpA-like peptidoglycan-associated protein
VSVGLNFGSLLPYGDIKKWDFWPTKEELSWGGGAIVNYQFSPLFAMQGQLLVGKLSGEKPRFLNTTGSYHHGQQANLKFEAEFYETSINFTVSLNRLLTPCSKLNNRLNIYALAGLGYVSFRSQLRKTDDDSFVASWGWLTNGTVKGNMTRELVIPVGMGVKYKINDRFDVYLESTIRNAYTDKLDAYVRANNSNDKYGFTSLGFIMRFGKQETHMDWVMPPCSESLDLGEIRRMNKKISELNKKVEDMEKECCDKVVVPDPIDHHEDIDSLNQKIKELENMIRIMEGKITEADLKKDVDLAELLVLSPIYFDVDKFDIRPDAALELDRIVEIMNEFPKLEIELRAHTDCRGSDKHNQELSDSRAKSSADYIKERIINPGRVKFKGYGKTMPKIDCSCDGRDNKPRCTDNDHQMNRRTEFIIISN